MALKAYTFKGLDADVFLPDDIEVIIDIVPDSMKGWVRSGTLFSGQTKTTWHNTGNSGSTAKGQRNYLHNGPMERDPKTGERRRRKVGFNFAVDDRRIYQLTPLNEVTWAAGTNEGNRMGWHVEQCFGGDINWERSLRNAVALHAGLIAAKKWNPDTALVRHSDWRRKYCPAQILDKGLWPTVQRRVGEGVRAITGRDVPGPFADPIPVDELLPFRDQNANTIPAMVSSSDGSPYYFVSDRVKAIKKTPRLQLANPNAKRVGPDIDVGEQFDALWIFVSSADGATYYLTPYDTRVAVADTARVGDARPPMDQLEAVPPGDEVPEDGILIEDEEVSEAPGH